MLRQFSILTMCQLEIKKCNLPIIEKLKLEMQLILAKRLLLDGIVSARVKDDANSETEFMDLYDHVCHACSTEGSQTREVAALVKRMVTIKEHLETHD